MNQMKAYGLQGQFLAKRPSDDPDVHVMGFFSSSIRQVNLIHTTDFGRLPDRTQPLDLVQEQQIDEVIREVIS